MKKILFVILIFLIPVGVLAQSNSNKATTKSKLYREARVAQFNGDIFTAIDKYQQYDNNYPGSKKIHNVLAHLYWQERNYPEAKKYFVLSYKDDPQKNIMELYYSAKCSHIMGQYDEAQKEYNRFAAAAKQKKELRNYTKLAKNIANSISEFSTDSFQNDIAIVHLDTTVNSMHIDFSPMPYGDDKLIYASLRENKINYYDIYSDTLPVRKFFVAEEKEDQSWNFVGEFDTIFNDTEADVGNGALSYDKKRFYFSKCKKDSYGKRICKIYVSKLENEKWQSPECLPEVINKNGSSSSMPALGISRLHSDVLYFVSDREGGLGGFDIWFSYYNSNKGEWKEAKNCGKDINTISDEITPFYDIIAKTLYFSSDGMPGYGGFDIFKSFGEGKNFSKPENIGKPANSNYDDLYYTIDESRQKGFLTSNRDGGFSLRHKNCCDDIYEFLDFSHIVIAVDGKVLGVSDSTYYKEIEEEYTKNRYIDLSKIEDNENIEVLYDYRVDLYMKDKDNNDYFLKSTQTTTGSYIFSLEPNFDYYISVKDMNGKDKTMAFTTKGITKSDTLHLDPIIIYSLPTRPIIIENIYYDFASYNLRDDSKTTIDTTLLKLMNDYPSIIIEISSHTDSIGSDESNMTLSQNRAQSVVNYLIQKGIKSERLIAKGYGKTMPIAPNSNPDGSDNPEGRQKNRRTEFKIIGHLENIELLYELE